jgi:hypothetical protein
VLVLACTAGCSTPVGVKRVGTTEAHHLLTASALSAGTPSQHSLQVLSRLDLSKQFEDDPAAALAALHAALSSTTDPDRLNNRFFALAELLRWSLFVTPLPCVKRVVFISTPHRGSYQAALRMGRLASWLVTLPGDLTQRTLTVMTQNQDKLLIQKLEKLPTSVDNMNPSHFFIKTLAAIPVAEGVPAHSIIPVLGEGPFSAGNDGIVAYDSAHIEGVESELVVRFGHSVQSHPKAIEEVRRILLEHLNDTERGGSEGENEPG